MSILEIVLWVVIALVAIGFFGQSREIEAEDVLWRNGFPVDEDTP